VIGVVVCLKYEVSIVLPSSDKLAANLFVLGILISLGLSILAYILTLSCPSIFSYWIKDNSFGVLLSGIPASLGLTGIICCTNYWLIRKQRFTMVSISRIGQTLFTVLGQIGAYFLISDPISGLIQGYIFGQVVGSLISISSILKNDFRSFLYGAISVKRIILGMKKYKKYPLVSSWQEAIGSFTDSLPTFFFARLFTNEIVGYYTFGRRAISAPLGLVGQSIGPVLFQRMVVAEAGDIGAKAWVVPILKKMAVFIFTFFIGMIFAPDIFAFVFGEEWRVSGEYMRILSLGLGFRFLSSPLTVVFNVKMRQEISALWKIIALATTVGCLYLFSENNANPEGLLWALTIVNVLLGILHTYFVIKVAYSDRSAI